MPSLPLGESAALATAFCWAATALFFESASRRVGSLPVNLIRLLIGAVLLAALNSVRRGLLFPVDAPASAWLWLGVSGLIGFAFGDLCLFRAFVLIGARLSVLIMSLVPPLTALIGISVLGETLRADQWLGMAMTVGGVVWVVLERPKAAVEAGHRPALSGILLGVGGAVGQAVGLVLSKRGMGSFDALAANQIRVAAGILGFAAIFTVTRRWGPFAEAFRHRHAMARTFAGGVFGPFLGVSLSLVAVQHTEAGVAATIMAVTPLILLPVSILRGEHVSSRAAIGALLAVAGTVLLFS
ncbi:MAG: DMT family transporter [Candidatus Eiseniibacteriota bacterium]